MIKMKHIIEGKYNPKNKDMWFVRFGGLSSKKQRGYKAHDEEPTYHQPPARRGIYAFPWPFIEVFLLGGDEYVNPKLQKKGQTLRIKYVKDKNGNVIDNTHPDYEKYAEKDKNWSMNSGYEEDEEGDQVPTGWKLYRNFNRKKFKYDGELWHHLGNQLKPNEILDKRGSWVKSDMNSFKKALNKEGILNKKSRMTVGAGFTKDHLEVFIEKV